MLKDTNLPPKVNLQDLITNDKNILQIYSRLKTAFNPTQMFLFGSRAMGTNREDSDYDIAVVVAHTDKDRIENMNTARKALFDLDITAEVFVYGQQEFDEWKNELNSIPEAAYNLGVELTLG